MKIKVTPEDFRVREAVDVPYDRSGPYHVYLLEKSGWNTVDAVEAIARASGVNPSAVKYAGLKDRHALTVQHISVPREIQLRSDIAGLKVTSAGFARDFISSRVLTGNAFEVVVRGISPDQRTFMESRLPEIKKQGFPNYFDDQRFGSVTPAGDFLAERLVKGHLKGALRIYLADVFPGQKRAERERRAAVSEAWGHWDRIAPLCAGAVERDIVALLQRGATRKNMTAALNLIPRAELAMHIAAYQGFLWNRSMQLVAGLAAEGMSGSGFTVPGKVGPYIFCRVLPEPEGRPLRDTEIPAVAADILPCPPFVAQAVDSAMREREVEATGFRLRGVRTAYFKSFNRRAALAPEDLAAGEFQADDVYRGSQKVRLKFSLPPGAYATMLLKALFGLPEAS